jgi:hypothetical protein
MSEPETRPVFPEGAQLAVAYGGADIDRVIRTFRSAWNRLPEQVRVAMLAYWSSPPPAGPPEADVNLLIVVISRREGTWDTSKAEFAVTTHAGYRIQVLSDVLNDMPDEILVTLMARQLAHVFHQAAGDQPHLQPHLATAEDVVGILTKMWGFDHATLDAFHAQWVARMVQQDPKWLADVGQSTP